ncbi:efflux RND transporter periplasmic adaptor subunit [bacterium]|nr:MAG: efflux RND transporter periplasmic adaptor subunit [bacterium]
MTRLKYFVVFIAVAAFTATCSKTPSSGKPSSPPMTAVAAGETSGDPGPAGNPLGKGKMTFFSGEPGGGRAAGRGGGLRGRNSSLVMLTEEESRAVEIKTVKPEFRAVRSKLKAMGKVLIPPNKKAIVSYAFPARIAEIHVSIGEWVRAGQKLVTLQSEEVGAAKSEFFKAGADYELARQNLEREKNLYQRGVGAQKNVLIAEAEFKVAEAGLGSTEKKLHVLGFTENQVKSMEDVHEINPVISLYALLDGKVIENRAVLGAMIDQSTEILTIMNPTVLCVDAEIYERDIARIKSGLDAEIAVPAYPGEVFPGKICYIGDIFNEETRTITVRTEVDNKKYKLKPGMFADMLIYLDRSASVLTLPEDAILNDRDDNYVFVKDGAGFRLQIVDLGVRESGHREILSGLMENDDVVTAGNFQLKSKLLSDILKKAGIH